MRSVVSLLVVACLCACGNTPGDDPHAGMTAVTLPGAAWRLWVPAPPFEPVESDDAHAVWRVPSTVDPWIMGGTAGGVLVMRVETVAGTDARAWIAASVTALRGLGGRITADTRAMSGASAGAVYEYAGTTYDGARRVAARAVPGGRVVVVTIEAPRDLADDADVTDVLRSVELASPDGGTSP